MPVDFLTDEQLASYGRFAGPPSQAELERFFFLDDADRGLAGKRSGGANVLGFGVQVGTARCLGMFLSDPADVPTVAVDYVAGTGTSPRPRPSCRVGSPIGLGRRAKAHARCSSGRSRGFGSGGCCSPA